MLLPRKDVVHFSLICKKLFVSQFLPPCHSYFFMARKIFLPRHAVIFPMPCVWRGVKENYLNGTQITQMRQMTTDFYFVQCSSLISLSFGDVP